jgi:hypothetical protein
MKTILFILSYSVFAGKNLLNGPRKFLSLDTLYFDFLFKTYYLRDGCFSGLNIFKG